MTRIALSLLSMLTVGSAIASPPTHNQLGYAHKIVSSGATMTVEITLKPKRSFDSVSVQAGTDAAITVNIVAESTPVPHALVHAEVHHLTLTNSAFVRPAAAAAASKHTLMSSGPSSK
jgi:hypothetical protein